MDFCGVMSHTMKGKPEDALRVVFAEWGLTTNGKLLACIGLEGMGISE